MPRFLSDRGIHGASVAGYVKNVPFISDDVEPASTALQDVDCPRVVIQSAVRAVIASFAGRGRALSSAACGFRSLRRDFPTTRRSDASARWTRRRLYATVRTVWRSRFSKSSGSKSRCPHFTQPGSRARSDRDQRFYDHHGFDIFHGFRGVHNIRHGRAAQGETLTGSWRAELYPDKTMRRKLQELILAARLERRYSKDRILELCANKVYFGDRTVSASRRLHGATSANTRPS